jgi:DNA-binding transcriptional regulator YiaG
MFSFPQPSFMPCEECGASVARPERDAHECERERRVDYQVVQLREEIEAFDSSLAAYLATSHGQFAAWDAERRRPPLQES